MSPTFTEQNYSPKDLLCVKIDDNVLGSKGKAIRDGKDLLIEH